MSLSLNFHTVQERIGCVLSLVVVGKCKLVEGHRSSTVREHIGSVLTLVVMGKCKLFEGHTSSKS